MDELLRRIEILRKRFELILPSLNRDAKKRQRDELQAEMLKPDFWQNRREAEGVSQKLASVDRFISFWDQAEKRLRDIEDIARDDDHDRSVELVPELTQALEKLERDVAEKEVELWLQDPHDERPAIVTVYSGAGGVDAQNWAEMLERMYLKFAELQDFRATILHRTPGQEAGIKNSTIRIAGLYAYGYLKAEAGVHRLVRLSPYDADQARHTSFAMVEVLPELDELLTVEVSEQDVRVDVFRSSGHGGQSVNTTDSAVRLTHLPTGITVSCQNERSQMQNKQQAWKILLGKLERYYQAQREEERQLLRGEFTEAAWGNQIRSYVLHPYKMVKDHRTKFTSADPDAVLQGSLMPFIEAELRNRVRARGSVA